MAKVTISKRAFKRLQRADKVCQEARRQIANYGGIADNHRMYELVIAWMRVSGKKVAYKTP